VIEKEIVAVVIELLQKVGKQNIHFQNSNCYTAEIEIDYHQKAKKSSIKGSEVEYLKLQVKV
jgi:hypothetical protein